MLLHFMLEAVYMDFEAVLPGDFVSYLYWEAVGVVQEEGFGPRNHRDCLFDFSFNDRLPLTHR